MKTTLNLMVVAFLSMLMPGCGPDRSSKAEVPKLTTQQKTERLQLLCFQFKEAKENWILKENSDIEKQRIVWEHFKAMIRACAAYQLEVGETSMTATVDGMFGRGTPAQYLMNGRVVPIGPRDEITLRTNQLILYGEEMALKNPYDAWRK